MCDLNKKTIGEDIIKSFHEQFAQNQNHHQKLFLQVLAVLLTVLVGFGYLYIRANVKSTEVKVTTETIYVFMLLSSYLLSLSIALISNMALGFRRDQLVACNIRVKTGTLIVNSNDGYFIGDFNPVGKHKYLLWMPEFHIIFFFTLLIVKILLILSLLLSSDYNLIYSADPNTMITISVFMSFFSFVVDFLVSLRYWKKWRSYSEKAPEILKNKNDDKT